MIKSKKVLPIIISFAMVLSLFGFMPITTYAATGTAIINISGLGGSDINNSAAADTESQWRYVDSSNYLFLDTVNGNYTLTGSNASLTVQNSFTNTDISLDNVSITSPTGSDAFMIADGAGCTLILIGNNYFSSDNKNGINTSDSTTCTITSSNHGTLTTDGINFAKYFNLRIAGNASVTSFGTNGNWGLSMSSAYENNIFIGDNAKLAYGNTISYESRTFQKGDASTTHKWKLTDADLSSGSLTGDTITVAVNARETGIIEREAIPYSLTVNGGTGSGNYIPGSVINIKADPASSGQEFDKWTTNDGGAFTNANNANTTFTMPANAVTITATYKPAIVKNPAVATPTPNNKAGTYTGSVSIKLTSTTSGAKIYYTLDGTTPKTTSNSVTNGGTVKISKTQTLRAMAAKSGNTNSSVFSGKYTIKTNKPTAKNVPKSKKIAKGKKITLKAPAGTTLYYTTNGKSPTTKVKTKVSPGKTKGIKINKKTTLKVIAVKKGCIKSSVVKRTYKIK